MTKEEAIKEVKSWDFLEGKEIEAIETLIPELRENEDENIRKELIEFLREAYSRGNAPEKCAKWIVWLDWLEEQKPAEWSEFDKGVLKDAICAVDILGNDESFNKDNPNLAKAFRIAKDRLKSLRPQPHKEIYQAAKHDLAIKFMNYLDENRSKDKMCLSNSECEDIDKAFKENDWAKIVRYVEKFKPHWKPSKEQMGTLKQWLQDHKFDGDSRYVYPIFYSLLTDLQNL